MAKFKPKAVEVEARQWDGTRANANALIAWVATAGMLAYFDDSQWPDALYVVVNTATGPAYTSPNYWIVLAGNKARVYEPDEFTANFSQA